MVFRERTKRGGRVGGWRTLASCRIEASRVQTWLNKLMQSNGRKRYLQLCQLALCGGERGGGQGADRGRERDERNRNGAFG